MTDCNDAFDRLLSSCNVSTGEQSAEASSGRNNSLNSDSEEEIARPIHSKKAVLDDSSDEETPPVIFHKGLLDFSGENNETQEKNCHSTQDSDEDDIMQRKKPTSRIKKLLDDSEDESALDDPPPRSLSPETVNVHADRPSSKIQDVSRHDDSDSDSSVSSNRSSRSNKSGRSSRHSSRSSSGGESEEEVSIEAIKSKIIKKHSAPKSSRLLTENDGQDPERKSKSKIKKEKPPSRKAKEAALAEIHSETQRMIRERQVSLPYHKPKQRSLADFLNRRKLAPTVRLKTTSDELEKVWRHAEEREKTAELFYRSESDEEPDKKNCDETKSTKSMNDTSLPQCHPSESTDENGCITKTTPDELPCEPIVSVSHQTESEEFPSLRLSELLTESQNTTNSDIFKSSSIINENGDSSDKHLPGAIEDSVEKFDEVNIPDKLPDDNSESVDHTNLVNTSESIIEDSAPLSGYSQNSLSERINSLNLPIPKCPKITGAPDDVIDLDELSTKPGAFGLMQRFIKHAKLKSKHIKQQNVVSIVTSEVNECGEVINVSEETLKVSKKVEPKPGERLVKLKNTLQQKMAENRGQQLAKKLEEYKLYEEEFYGVDRAEGDEDIFSDYECDGKEEKAVEDNDNDEDIDNPFVEGEADESENEECANDVDDEKDGVSEDDEEDAEKSETSSVLLGGHSDGEDEVSENEETAENNILPSNLVPAGLHSLAGTQNSEPIDESQLMALCSGNFSSSAIDLKGLETAAEGFQDDADHESLDSDSKDLSKSGPLDSDDEEILVSKKQKPKKRKLSFSDEEDSNKGDDEALSDVDDDGALKLALNDDDEAAEQNEEVDSDDEQLEQENPVEEDEDDEEVQLAKKLSKGFLDKEAELSESEWGSEDEDEKGLDQYEEEEGDKEKISQRRLQKELGKIHMREVLADDNREIRILQELLLEDGDLHSDGPKRQRLFRWYNQDEDNPGEKRSLDSGENANENDEDDEELWRRQRLERENFLRKKKIDNLELEIVDSPVNFNDTRKGVKVTPKIALNKNKSPDPKSTFSIFSKRGSFLGRGERMLSKLAEITNNAGTKDNALGNSRSNRNMVFAVVSPPKDKQNEDINPEAPLKRKSEFSATSIVKKIKFTRSNGTTKVSALEQLKLFEST